MSERRRGKRMALPVYRGNRDEGLGRGARGRRTQQAERPEVRLRPGPADDGQWTSLAGDPAAAHRQPPADGGGPAPARPVGRLQPVTRTTPAGPDRLGPMAAPAIRWAISSRIEVRSCVSWNTGCSFRV